MSYTRERKVEHVETDVLVWAPKDANLALEEASPASLAEAGLCDAKELARVREELRTLKDAVRAETQRCIDVIRACQRGQEVIWPDDVIRAIKKGAP